MHTYKDKNITNFYIKTKQVKPASKIENPTGVGCRLLRP